MMEKKKPFDLVYQTFRVLFDAILPPRSTARVVEALSLETLQALAHHDGTLPYHEPAVRALVWELKYYANPRAAKLSGAFMAERVLDEVAEELGVPLLLPIPMHPARKRTRGHNQTEILCQEMYTHLSDSVDYKPHALVRTRNTRPQQGLQRHVRLTNIENSMEVINPHEVLGRVCIVVDDVSTTGATMAEARRALMEAGARKVCCVYLAHS